MAPASPFPELSIFQIAIVVRDLDAAATRHSALIGDGPWRVYEFGPHMMGRYEMHCRPASARTLVALNDSHPQVEILQPLSGRASTGTGWTSAARGSAPAGAESSPTWTRRRSWARSSSWWSRRPG